MWLFPRKMHVRTSQNQQTLQRTSLTTTNTCAWACGTYRNSVGVVPSTWLVVFCLEWRRLLWWRIAPVLFVVGSGVHQAWGCSHWGVPVCVVWVCVRVCGRLRSVVRIIIQSTYQLFLGTIEAGQFCGPNKVLLCLRNFVSGFEV